MRAIVTPTLATITGAAAGHAASDSIGFLTPDLLGALAALATAVATVIHALRLDRESRRKDKKGSS